MSKGLAAWEVSPDCHAAAAPSVCGQEMRPDKSRRPGQEKQRPPLPGYCHWGKSGGVGWHGWWGDEERKERGDGRGCDVGTSRKKVGGHTVMPIGARRKRPCHARKRVEASVWRERFCHRLASGVDIVSFCESDAVGCGGLVFFFCLIRCLSLFTSQVHVASTPCQAELYLRRLIRGLRRAAASAPGQAVAETMAAARDGAEGARRVTGGRPEGCSQGQGEFLRRRGVSTWLSPTQSQTLVVTWRYPGSWWQIRKDYTHGRVV